MCIDKQLALQLVGSLLELVVCLIIVFSATLRYSLCAVHYSGNHKYVMEKFPIGEPLYEPPEEDVANGDMDMDKTSKKEPKKFGDQLDWWQTIGRWK